MTREEVYKFIEIVRRIREGGGPLSKYFERQVADAIQGLIDSAVKSAVEQEREACAVAAEGAADPAGAVRRRG